MSLQVPPWVIINYPPLSWIMPFLLSSFFRQAEDEEEAWIMAYTRNIIVSFTVVDGWLASWLADGTALDQKIATFRSTMDMMGRFHARWSWKWMRWCYCKFLPSSSSFAEVINHGVCKTKIWIKLYCINRTSSSSALDPRGILQQPVIFFFSSEGIFKRHKFIYEWEMLISSDLHFHFLCLSFLDGERFGSTF